MVKNILILGATGSIGTNTIDIIRTQPDIFKLNSIVAGSNANKLAEIAFEFNVQNIGIFDLAAGKILKELLAGTKAKIYVGPTEILEMCQIQHDVTVSSIIGAAGLAPTMAAIPHCKTLALANKESIVCAGSLLKAKVKKHGVQLVPVDSEHSAIFQCLHGNTSEEIKTVTLTASGGPFRTKTLQEMRSVTKEQALKHPNWSMGGKITIDSATLANKGLEFIEACELFPITPKQLEVLVHPQSIIHSMVTYQDSSTIAQLGLHDMRTAIAYGMSYPIRLDLSIPSLDLAQIGNLTFEAPDFTRFPMLKMAMDAMDAGLAARIIYNAADEIAVASFLKGEIGFLDIADTVARALDEAIDDNIESIEAVLDLDNSTRRKVSSRLLKKPPNI